MSQKRGNNVKSPVKGSGEESQKTMKQNLTDQHHGENTNSFQDDKKIGQHNGAGRPPLMKK